MRSTLPATSKKEQQSRLRHFIDGQQQLTRARRTKPRSTTRPHNNTNNRLHPSTTTTLLPPPSLPKTRHRPTILLLRPDNPSARPNYHQNPPDNPLRRNSHPRRRRLFESCMPDSAEVQDAYQGLSFDGVGSPLGVLAAGETRCYDARGWVEGG